MFVSNSCIYKVKASSRKCYFYITNNKYYSPRRYEEITVTKKRNHSGRKMSNGILARLSGHVRVESN